MVEIYQILYLFDAKKKEPSNSIHISMISIHIIILHCWYMSTSLYLHVFSGVRDILTTATADIHIANKIIVYFTKSKDDEVNYA